MSATQVRKTLSASQQLANSLLRRRHEDKLQVLRMKAEDDPGCGLSKRLRDAEKLIANGDLARAGDAMAVIERLLAERSEAHAITAALAETVRMAKARKEEVEVDGPASRGAKKGEEPPIGQATAIRILTRDGLLWLKAKKRLEAPELAALERYRGLFDRVHAGGSDSTVAAERGPGGGGEPDLAAKKRVEAMWELDDARNVLSHDQALLWLLDEVAGRGRTLRDLAKGDQPTATRLEAELRVAARLLAKFFKLRA